MAVSLPLDPDHASRAASGLDIVGIDQWADRFDLLSDAHRLRLLVCLHHAPDISVSDLAAAVGKSGTAVSQALRLLRQQGWVTSTKDGRIVRYRLADDTIHELLHWIGATHAADTVSSETS
ncbi:ArsR/SmtB family transcription factor [Nocardia bhagyanarayanae]|uniref:DNA-binding transcriptional ArsR family regulator n=1 Tax=Nocardia bhagyanarayanae TaxID=1215925 RepID=A0A543EV40_9NOCA|nr:metalloregulator ArsR/SmtB family transcription factor [Nocardia bhagyanarayanae]TQM25443.1 DNA-binding transcriptional ArsR family regulator [Nocardia bhagyanarayanae]